MNKYFQFFCLMMVSLCLMACSRESSVNQSHIIIVKEKGFSNTLYYSGTIQPFKTVVVTCPVDGVIVDMPFQYGELVNTHQLLFKISSAKFLTDYKAALMQYIKAKSDFTNNKTLLSEATFLHKNQLISDDEFKMKQSTYYASQLTLLQAKDTLENLLHQLGINKLNPYQLTIADVGKITEEMHLKMNAEHLQITSPVKGMVLSASKNENENKKMMKGDAIKQGDTLALIGDMSGITVRIKVNELIVNQLKNGQTVKITGIAFPDEILQGEIIRIDRQGESSNGGFPTFNVEVSVLKLSESQQHIIHAGMSAKVEIDIKEGNQIMIPIATVSEKNGETRVEKINTATGKIESVAIRTGKTTVDSVVVLSGIKSGDRIVIPH